MKFRWNVIQGTAVCMGFSVCIVDDNVGLVCGLVKESVKQHS